MKLSIFYLDDDAEQLQIFELIFNGDYVVRTASRLAEARRILSECPADIIISDQSMPEISGTEFLSEAAQACPDSFRILLTGYVAVGDVLPEISNGIIHQFITKPWHPVKMREVLTRAGAALERRINT
jgi:two-component system response regulator HupR/HoxA